MDIATIGGIILALAGLIGGVLMEGAKLSMYFNIPSALIVLVGTLGVSTITTSMHTLKSLPKFTSIAMKQEKHNIVELISTLVSFSEKARREGLLALEDDAHQLENEFLRKGIQLIVDGTDPELVRTIMETEITYIEERHHHGIAFYEAAGGFAPTLGIMGTVMGLVNILANLSNPDELGHLISGAFIATLYGVGSANLLFLPLANKLKLKNKEEMALCEVMVEGVLSIQAGDNPRIVEEKLKSFLDPHTRKLAGSKDKEDA